MRENKMIVVSIKSHFLAPVVEVQHFNAANDLNESTECLTSQILMFHMLEKSPEEPAFPRM